jgi:hypothetical protein
VNEGIRQGRDPNPVDSGTVTPLSPLIAARRGHVVNEGIGKSSDPNPADGGAVTPLSTLELLLGEGSAAQRAELRERSGRDPLAMLELADDVAFLAQCRELRTEPSPIYAAKLHAVARRAERARPLATGSGQPWRGLLWAAAAAIATFALLWTTDPLGRRCARAPLDRLVADADAGVARPEDAAADGREPSPAPGAAADVSALAWEAAIERMRHRLELEASPHLRDAFETGLRDDSDRLGRWLDPRNALVLMRLDHELRANAEVRREALARQGGLPAVDGRVQQLAAAIAQELMAESPPEAGGDRVTTMALAVRALLGAGADGADRDRARDQAGDWLAARLPDLHGGPLVEALAALTELAAVTGRHFEPVALHGRRLVDSVLSPDAQNWERSLPALLGSRLPPAVIGDASRLLQRLPGFGVDGGRCALVRKLLSGQLRARRDGGQDGPELLAALVYGCGDLLTAAEREAIDLQLRRWKPVRLAPDFRTVQQLAWAFEPGRSGFTRTQGELRQLAVCPDPVELAGRAAFCLCLCTNFAAFGQERARLAGGI